MKSYKDDIAALHWSFMTHDRETFDEQKEKLLNAAQKWSAEYYAEKLKEVERKIEQVRSIVN